ncbi:hypothetical protein [Burkholderia ubonensis]|uniref:hypothetical protein n=2 Tax=Burkholderia ubonensis TaxID=101571 RepID=UPI000A7D1E4C|nr:hypothetical protein [Burkholderia ubonensis]
MDAIRDDDRRDAGYIARRSRSRHARECGGGGAFTERCRPQAVASSGMHRGQLNLWTKWALVRSEDVLNPRNLKFYFWVEPIGEGEGSGFTRAFQDTGDLQQQCHVWSWPMRRFIRARAALTHGTHAHGLIRPEANTGPGAIQNSLDATAATAAAFAPQTGPYGTATPTASTLNPEYVLLWQIPLQTNRGKQMLFKIVYEAGWNNCIREDCAGMR